MKLYLYGIIDSSDQVKDSIYGLEGVGVYNIPFYDIGAVVSELSELSELLQNVTKNGVLTHEEVIERLTEHFTVLPVKFHTVFDGKDSVLSMMQSYYKHFKDNLNRLHDKVEFGIKVIWPADKIKKRIANSHKKSEHEMLISDGSSNKKFMRKKLEKYRINKEFEKRANKFINVMDIFFSKFAVEKTLKKLKTENLLLDAAYLVENYRQDDFKEAFKHIKSAHIGFKFLLSGPWPPYNFVILPNNSDLLKDSEKENLFDKVIQHQDLIGTDKK